MLDVDDHNLESNPFLDHLFEVLPPFLGEQRHHSLVTSNHNYLIDYIDR